MLKGIEQTSKETVVLINAMKDMMADYKSKLKALFGTKYNHELLNNIFRHPYTKIDYIVRDLEVSRQTASKYLDEMVDNSMLNKVKIGYNNYYINQGLVNLFVNQADLYKV